MSNLRSKVVVVTGASSGLGREVAVQFAAQGCCVVAAARRDAALQETVSLCRRSGGDALAVVADVTREADMIWLVESALARWGRIDVWVNNAGVTLFGSLEEAPMDEHRRVIEVNLFGAINGARAVIPIFRRQKHGILINVGSVLSTLAQPFVPSYVISKFALRGLTEALRTELADERGVHICAIYPYAMDTEHFQTGANHIGHPAHPMPPLQSPEKVARAMVKLAKRPRRQLLVPRYAIFGIALHRLLPRTMERTFLHTLKKWHFGDGGEAQHRGNLFGPIAAESAVHGERQPRLSTAGFLFRGAASFVAALANTLWRPISRQRLSGNVR
jgi:NAD(P)-dependent dehydrogenase (short-subunit alcohol dehydrogenase family)